jgi:hypothetical protein
LHRRARPQTGIKKDQRDRSTSERLGLIVAALEAQGRLNQLLKSAFS